MITAYVEWRWIGRWIPGTIAALVLFSGACRHGGPGNSNPAPRGANLLLITLDTTRPDHLSCYSDSKDPGAVYRYARTPHLDALARRGVRFLQATAQVPLTLPSHASIMTGEYPTRHGVRDNSGFSLSPSHPTIASRAQAHGYTTAAFVGCRVLARQFGLANGFTTYDDDIGGENERTLDLRAAPERRAGVVTDRALAWLKANGQKRFFLWVHYYDPHAPYDPPEPYKHLYADDLYSGEIAYMDQEVGRLLHGLREMRLESRTLVTVLGDHGESLGEHGEVTHGVFLYESTLHIPMLMAGPDVPAGKIIDAQVRSIDVMPTLLEFLHIAPGKEAQGTSLWPLISRDIHVRSNYSYGETILPRIHLGWSELRSMRTDTWKLILAPRPELYNLEHDPAETENLITNHPADADQLQKHIWEAAGHESRREKVAVTPVDPQTRQELESLGYIGAGTPREIQLGADAPDPKDRSSVLRLLEQSNEQLGAKSYAAAAHLLERASRLDPTNPRVHIKLAAAYEGMGQYPRAIRILNDAIAKHIETDRVYSRLGTDYLRLNRSERAVAPLEQAAKLNPTDLDNAFKLGITYLQLGRQEDAAKTFKLMLTLDPHYAFAYDGLAFLAVARKNPEEARHAFEQALAANPDDIQAMLNLGMLYQQTGQDQQALHYLQLFLEKAPPDQYRAKIAEVRQAVREMGGK